ncbi:MAG TPA: hypothetical protein GXX75_11855 [Clostridiales bacterium]|nr:hypothetical protein [Clostridiales bacterium]
MCKFRKIWTEGQPPLSWNHELWLCDRRTGSIPDTPRAGGEVGTLAYYAPWADVVMFFGSYSPNNSLYELGQATSGNEQIQSLEGTITIEAVL